MPWSAQDMRGLWDRERERAEALRVHAGRLRAWALEWPEGSDVREKNLLVADQAERIAARLVEGIGG